MRTLIVMFLVSFIIGECWMLIRLCNAMIEYHEKTGDRGSPLDEHLWNHAVPKWFRWLARRMPS